MASEPLPQDPSLRIGLLTNGLRYYIQENPFPESRACLRLIVKAGSIHEEEHQQGLAHFLEHMVFRGTENFDDYEIVDYLQSIGAQFGPDTNAYTTFDHTHYMLDVPLEEAGALEKGIQILSDFAGRAKLEDSLIEIERGVVCDELNQRLKNAGGRTLDQVLSLIFGDSIYAKRPPIGRKEIILHGDPQAIRDFYERWYRPDRMMVVVIGSIQADEVETLLSKHFGDLQIKDSSPLPVVKLQGSPSGTGSVDFISDPEFAYLQGSFLKLEELSPPKERDEKSIREDLSQHLFRSILHQRLENAVKENPPPLLYAASQSQPISWYHQLNLAFFVGLPEDPYVGLERLCQEYHRLRTQGPSQVELEIAKQGLISSLEQQEKNLDRIPNAGLVHRCVDHFVHGIVPVKPEQTLELELWLLSEIDTEDIASAISDDLSLQSYRLAFQSSDSSNLDETLIRSTIERGLNVELREIEEEVLPELQINGVSPTTLPEVKLREGKIHYYRFELPQGPTGYVHNPECEKGQLSLTLVAPGCISLLSPEQYASAGMAGQVLLGSGLGDLDGPQLEQVLQLHGLSLQVSLGIDRRLITVQGSTEHQELMFQLLSAVFQEKKIQPDVWENSIELAAIHEESMTRNPHYYFWTHVDEWAHQHHPLCRHIPVTEARREEVEGILHDFFSQPSEFTLIATGEADSQEIAALCATYLDHGTLNSRELPDILGGHPVYAKTDEELIIERGLDPHGMSLVLIQAEVPTVSGTVRQALYHILQDRMTKKIRRENGETYGIYIHSGREFPRTQLIETEIQFSSEPESRDKIIRDIEDVLDEVMKGGVSEEEVVTARNLIHQHAKREFQSNHTWTTLFIKHVLNGGSEKELEEFDFDEILFEEVTKENIQKLARKALSGVRLKASLVPDRHGTGLAEPSAA